MQGRRTNRLARLIIPICIALLTPACHTLPLRTPPGEAMSLSITESGRLQQVAARIAAGLEGNESAFWLLDGAKFSFDVRLALVDQADTSLDIQYFILEKDPTSRLFMHRVVQAADRGVRVRILLDDLTVNGKDGELAALAKHPNISVRTFNPWNSRSNFGRVGEFFLNIGRLNHRMHNKTIIADGHFAILGGRNIGDRYFGVWEEFVQNDLDVMASGPAAVEVAESFDLYWNSDLSFAITDVAKPRAAAVELEPARAALESGYRGEQERLSSYPLEPYSWSSLFEELIDEAAPGVGILEQDLPDVQRVPPDQFYPHLLEMLARAERRVLLCTAYLIPDQAFVDLLADLEQRGVEVILLTNSLASNNHLVAHTAYKLWRKDLLAIGVDLFEARDDSIYISEYTTPPIESAFLGLHSKAIVVDDRYSFIGSPNIDPRSLLINTELGFFIDSEPLARRLSALLERDISPEAAWRVYQDDRGRLRWTSSAGTVKKQPALGLMQRVTAFFINWLPLKSQA
jgi:putative cardiolipin synthase